MLSGILVLFRAVPRLAKRQLRGAGAKGSYPRRLSMARGFTPSPECGRGSSDGAALLRRHGVACLP